MPTKNSIREFAAEQYYHVYNRGVAKQPVFLDDADKKYFLGLFARHLDLENTAVRADGREYEKYNIEVLGYCLMKNHFHLLVYQPEEPDAVTQLMKSVSTAYAMYFNHRYQRVGPIFQGRFKASRIDSDVYLAHMSRYIHLNPRTYRTYRWSSLPEFTRRRQTSWVKPDRILDKSPSKYMEFLEDFDTRGNELRRLRKLLF